MCYFEHESSKNSQCHPQQSYDIKVCVCNISFSLVCLYAHLYPSHGPFHRGSQIRNILILSKTAH